MMTIKQKLKELKDFNMGYFKEQIADLEMLLSNNKKKSGGFTLLKNLHTSKNEIERILIQTKQDFENLKNDKFDDIFGWDYFDDVYYFDDEKMKDFDDLMSGKLADKYLKEYPADKIFKFINKLAYLDNEIDRLLYTQKNIKKNRLSEPSKEVLTILKYLGDGHEAIKPLVRLLASMQQNYSDELSHIQKEIYSSCDSESLSRPFTNKDRLVELKKEYNEEILKLKKTLKKQKIYNNEALETILSTVSLKKNMVSRS